jgi:Family of unknown function (DUF6174)
VRRLVPLILTGIAVAALASSAAATTPRDSAHVGPVTDVVDPQILDGTEQRRLDSARDRWRRRGAHHYRLRLALRCFCPSEITAPAVIFVRNGHPLNARSHLRRAATVTRLLRIVQSAIDERVSGLSVRYDSRGIPRSIGIDSRRQIADDELEYRVDRFWRGTTGRGGPERNAQP